MYNASDLKKGLKIQIDGEPYVVIAFSFAKPGKGQALYRCKLRNMINGSQFDRTFRSADTFQPANLREKKMQYLYPEEGKYCFMDVESYEQVFLTAEQVEDARNFLIDNLEVEILFFEDRPLGITLPNFVELTVVKADPWVKGDTVSGKSKPVTLETGYLIQAPPFIGEGEKIRVDTRTGEYMTRVKD
ncbi:MAG: elongation factor P [Proteobacteria bacterium]|nr:elongation factor P [Pseudomonadota bacterium]